MSRAIKFRAWCITERYWDDQILDTRSISRVLDCNTHVLQQYTGVKDKDSREIYEGDILEFKCEGFNLSLIYKVDFFEGSFVNPYSYRRVGDGELEVIGRAFNTQLKRFNECRIIGNIFENPELIK